MGPFIPRAPIAPLPASVRETAAEVLERNSSLLADVGAQLPHRWSGEILSRLSAEVASIATEMRQGAKDELIMQQLEQPDAGLGIRDAFRTAREVQLIAPSPAMRLLVGDTFDHAADGLSPYRNTLTDPPDVDWSALANRVRDGKEDPGRVKLWQLGP